MNEIELPEALQPLMINEQVFDDEVKLPRLIWSMLLRFRGTQITFKDLAGHLGVPFLECRELLSQLKEVGYLESKEVECIACPVPPPQEEGRLDFVDFDESGEADFEVSEKPTVPVTTVEFEID